MIIIYYDLETTGLNLQKDQICQISAVSEGDFFGKFIETGIKIPGTLPSIGPDILPGLTGQVQCYPFDIYLRPEVEFNSKASEINGMAKDQYGNLFKNGQEVEQATDMKMGLELFLNYLEHFDNHQELILVSHNNFKFDSKILLKNLGAYHLRLPQRVSFADTIDFMKFLRQNGHRGRNGQEFGRFAGALSLKNCLLHMFGENLENAHDAMSDTIALRKITEYGAVSQGYDNYNAFLRKDGNTRTAQQIMTGRLY